LQPSPTSRPEPAERGVEGKLAPRPLPPPASLTSQPLGACLAPQLLAVLTDPFLKHFVVEHDSSS
jgi:hypothetical protein